jgi:hypothetical protein
MYSQTHDVTQDDEEDEDDEDVEFILDTKSVEAGTSGSFPKAFYKSSAKKVGASSVAGSGSAMYYPTTLQASAPNLGGGKSNILNALLPTSNNNILQSQQGPIVAQNQRNGFEIDIDSLEDKPWRKPGVDMTDYFNYGFNEDSWKQYCQKQVQVRLEQSMQTKIKVYESGGKPDTLPSDKKTIPSSSSSSTMGGGSKKISSIPTYGGDSPSTGGGSGGNRGRRDFDDSVIQVLASAEDSYAVPMNDMDMDNRRSQSVSRSYDRGSFPPPSPFDRRRDDYYSSRDRDYSRDRYSRDRESQSRDRGSERSVDKGDRSSVKRDAPSNDKRPSSSSSSSSSSKEDDRSKRKR